MRALVNRAKDRRMTAVARSLDQELDELRHRRMLAMPMAGSLAWLAVLIGGLLLDPRWHLLLVFVATGCIAYLGMGLSKLTGENFMDKHKPRNRFDMLFLMCVGQAALAYALVIPLALVLPHSVPYTVGMLTGFMWLPFAWIHGHPIGAIHAVLRTLALLLAWWLAPTQGMLWAPLIVLASYGCTVPVMERVWRQRQASRSTAGRALPA